MTGKEDDPSKPGPQKGRPCLPKDQAHSERVVTFVTPQDLARLSAVAHASKRSLSATCRQMLMRSLDEVAPPIDDKSL